MEQIAKKERMLKVFGKKKKANIQPEPPKPKKFTKKQLEELEDQFFIENMEYLQSLSHRITMKRMNQYPDFELYLAAYEDCICALNELRDFCFQSMGGTSWFNSMYRHCHNSQNRDFNLEKQIRANYEDLKKNQADYKLQFDRRKS